jgi:hypothetical protein
MKAIPTTYAGVEFRSRLEASVAAHFDKIGLRWDYEPEGFELSDGTRYLPDFYLPQARAWLEVKGAHNERTDKLEKFAAELWAASGATDTYDACAPMILLVNDPTHYLDHNGDRVGELYLGVHGLTPGGGYSAGFAKCDRCGAVTAIAFFQPKCRNCGMAQTGEGETWNGWRSWMDVFMTPFVRLRSEYRR